VEPTVATDLPKRAASTTGYLFSTADPFIIYEIQASGTTVVAITSIGLNAVFIDSGGSAITYLSGYELDTGDVTAPATDCTFQMLILGAVEREDNDIAYANAKFLVLLTPHHFAHAGLESAPTAAGSMAGLLGV
jgi:hypothetical protein